MTSHTEIHKGLSEDFQRFGGSLFYGCSDQSSLKQELGSVGVQWHNDHKNMTNNNLLL